MESLVTTQPEAWLRAETPVSAVGTREHCCRGSTWWLHLVGGSGFSGSRSRGESSAPWNPLQRGPAPSARLPFRGSRSGPCSIGLAATVRRAGPRRPARRANAGSPQADSHRSPRSCLPWPRPRWHHPCSGGDDSQLLPSAPNFARQVSVVLRSPPGRGSARWWSCPPGTRMAAPLFLPAGAGQCQWTCLSGPLPVSSLLWAGCR